jgi:hypothetical protein
MRIRIPEPPVPVEERKLTFGQIGSRWRVPAALARLQLSEAGIAFVDVEQKPTKGVRLSDLLVYEAKLRTEMSQPPNGKLKKIKPFEVVR